MCKKITIIVPIFNGEKYIERCIKNVMNQRYDNYEAILIDDGSTDGTRLICDQYAQMDNRIFVYTQKNSGVSAARNRGLAMATGEFICFMDSDDQIDENYLKNLVESYDACAGKVQLVIHGCKIDFCKGGVVKETRFVQPEQGRYTPVDILNEIDRKIPLVSVQTVWGNLYRREIIENNSLRFDENVGLTEDYLFNLSYMHKIQAVYINNHMDYHYIKTEKETAVHKYHPEYMNTICTIISMMQDMVQNQKPEFLAYVFEEYCRTIYHYYSNYSRNSREERLDILKKLENAPLFTESLKIRKQPLMYRIFRLPLMTHNIKLEDIFFRVTSLVRRY